MVLGLLCQMSDMGCACQYGGGIGLVGPIFGMINEILVLILGKHLLLFVFLI